ncbi:MAG: hypothetical protein H6710_04470 [Myxococcales bacterium]|nr:hypothetical protein [Myxococcales bacterium]
MLGRRFGVDALDHLVVGAHTQLPALIAAELLEADVDAYLFRHDLVRDAVYGGLLPEARSALHRRAATWYRERDPLMVARHLDGAHDPEAAAAYLEAARHEQAIQRLPSALALARRGELLAEDEALSVELGLTCGELERRLGMVDDSLATFRALAPRAASEAQRLRAYLGQADALNLSDRHDEALAVLGRASGSTEEPALLAAIHSLRGNILFSCGDSSSCRREHERALAAARRAGDAAAEARALNGIGDAYYLTGAYRSTHGALHECIAIAQREQMPALESLSLSISAASRVFYGDVVGAHEDVLRAEALADQAMDAKAQVLAASVAAKVNLYLLDLDASERAGQRVLARSRRVGTLRLAQYALLRIAWVAERRGQPELAMRRLEEAWTLASEVGKLFLGSALLAGMAVLDRSRAAALLDEGEELLHHEPRIDHNTLYFHVHGVRAAYQIGDEARLRRYAQALLDDQGESRELRGFHGKCGLLLADLLAGRSEALAELRALHGWALAQSLRWDAALLDELLVERGA